jgi:eukaryotic-like serine/threonine-protein kinase
VAAQQQFVGNYRMYHLIRAGAIYEIWAVRPMAETTVFAMKWLPPGQKYSRHTVGELRHEYQVGVSLDHPACIKTYEFDTTNNGAYLLLELFKVQNLKQQILAGYKKLHYRAQDILAGAASGLAHVHEKGWVHRDVKPDNFLLGDDDTVKLIDFNLARKPPGGLGKLLRIKTTVAGTRSYMSPEQIRGQQVDFRADVYSFGCMVYELLAGKLPFTANSPNELLQQHLKARPPDLTVIDKNITPDFSKYVQGMMSKEPSERPHLMKDVLMELKAQKIFYNKPQPPAEEESIKAAREE